MAFKMKCQTCGGVVSDEAQTCPHCGQPKPGCGWGCVVVLVALPLALLAAKVLLAKLVA